MRRFYFSLALACSLAGTLWASDDPFCGKWKLNLEKSDFAGEQIKIQHLHGSEYKWGSGEGSDTISHDGTYQTVSFGRTISMFPEGSNSWSMVIKKDGRVISSMTHTLSDDGKMQTIKGTETKPDGTTSDFTAVWKKVSGGKGWSGTWEATDVKYTSPDDWDIDPYEGDGCSLRAGMNDKKERVFPVRTPGRKSRERTAERIEPGYSARRRFWAKGHSESSHWASQRKPVRAAISGISSALYLWELSVQIVSS